ncbi:PAS domain-containing protein [Solirhodobacter olei]|uniref:PAS domain-containing protein n=1 Tax=Solirhodobacter olei TaxID=2493082 RepID=UPI0013E2B982|nr:PAS domain-containing protein [Solirhodobacter olei]
MALLGGRGEYADRFRAFDWDSTPLGPMSDWPAHLRATVDLLLRLKTPSCLFWGPNGTVICNEAWAADLGSRQGAILGQSAGRISGQFHLRYAMMLQRPKDAEVSDACDALLPLLWPELLDRQLADLTCTPVANATGEVAGMLIQLPLSSRNGHDLANGNARIHPAHDRLGFELRLSDALRRLDDPVEIEAFATRSLGEFIDADRVSYAEYDLVEGTALLRTEYRRDENAPPSIGKYDLGDFRSGLEQLQAGLPLVIADLVNEIGQLGVEQQRFRELPSRAQLTVPIQRAGRLVASVTVRHDAVHHWTPAEIGAVHAASLRTWEAVERARAEAALRRSEERLRRVLETDAMAVLFFATDGTLIGSNDVFLKMTGFSREEVEGRRLHWRDMTPPEYVAESEAQMTDFVRTGRIGPYEKEYLRKDGGRSWFLFTGRDLGDGTIVEFAIDIADRKRAEAALRDAEARLHLAQQAAGVGTFDWVIETNQGHWSAELLQILGLQEGHFGGTYEDWIATIHPDDLQKAVSSIEYALGSGELEGEWRVVRPDGETIWVQVRGIVEHDAAHRPIRLTGAQVDITERVRSEQQMKFLLAELDARIEALQRDLRSRGG